MTFLRISSKYRMGPLMLFIVLAPTIGTVGMYYYFDFLIYNIPSYFAFLIGCCTVVLIFLCRVIICNTYYVCIRKFILCQSRMNNSECLISLQLWASSRILYYRQTLAEKMMHL